MADDLRVAISGKDTIVNDINKPYSQEEIVSIAKIKVFDENNNDITNLLKLKEDNYQNNKNRKGVFKQVYSINLYDEEYLYILNIYNVDLLLNNFTCNIQIYNLRRMNINEIIELVEEQNQIIINQFNIIEDNYSNNFNKEGTYLLRLKISTNKGEEQELLINIDVVLGKESSSTILIIIGTIVGIIILGATSIYFFVYKRRRNEKK